MREMISSCEHCGRPIGVRDSECTGWHPDFKCECGYEAAGENGVRAERNGVCPHCGVDQILGAEFIK